MVRRAHVENGRVVNISVVMELSDGEIDGTDARIGDDYIDGQFVTPPYVEPVPGEVTPLQIRRALRQLGHSAAVAVYVSAQSEEVQEAWEFATRIPYDDPLIDAAASGLGLDKAALFRLAATL